MACFVQEGKILIVEIDHLAYKISLKVHLMKEYNDYRHVFDCIYSNIMSPRQ